MKKDEYHKYNLEYNATIRNESRGNNRRFYTSRDMAIIKKDIAKRKGEIKRGEVKEFGNEIIYKCGCGREGCFIHTGYESNIKK